MKIIDGFVIREIAGEWMAVAVGKRTAEFPGIIALSDTAAFVWKLLEKECSVEDLVQGIMGEYDIDSETAKNDVVRFVDELAQKGLLDNTSDPA